MEIILGLLVLVGRLIYLKKDKEIFNIIMVVLMYGFYLLYWIAFFFYTERNQIKYHSSPILMIGLITIITAPIYLLIHILFIRYTRKIEKGKNKIYRAHLIGIFLLVIQIIALTLA